LTSVKNLKVMVAHTSNPSSKESGDGRIKVQGQPREKVNKTLFPKTKIGVVAYICNLSYMAGK
jgi:hypothetical protein